MGGSMWLLASKKHISQMTSMVPVNFEFRRHIKHSKEGDSCVSCRREVDTNFYFLE